jgi:hypothetical protein
MAGAWAPAICLREFFEANKTWLLDRIDADRVRCWRDNSSCRDLMGGPMAALSRLL